MSRSEIPEFLLPHEVADLFRVDMNTVGRWAREGKIESRRTLGGRYRYPSAQFAAVIAARGWQRGDRR